jgi:hypothetical protein
MTLRLIRALCSNKILALLISFCAITNHSLNFVVSTNQTHLGFIDDIGKSGFVILIFPPLLRCINYSINLIIQIDQNIADRFSLILVYIIRKRSISLLGVTLPLAQEPKRIISTGFSSRNFAYWVRCSESFP